MKTKSLLYKLLFLVLTINLAYGQSDSQSKNVDDSLKNRLSYEKGISILRGLFDGNDSILENSVSIDLGYPWIKFCEGKIGPCNPFNDTYKQFFTEKNNSRINACEFVWIVSDSVQFDKVDDISDQIVPDYINVMEFKYTSIELDVETGYSKLYYRFIFTSNDKINWKLTNIEGDWL
jgi:hypothetical protein